jgi:nucleoside-diphosphate-sugar epimerase
VTSLHSVLLYGGTGRTGGRVLTLLLERGVTVRAIVRDVARLPDGVDGHPLLTTVEADLLGLAPGDLARHLDDCDTVVCCLGHTISVRGIFGRPRDLVTQAVRRTVTAVDVRRSAAPRRLILMSSVSVNQADHADTVRRGGERAFLTAVRALQPPAKDNQAAADFLALGVGPDNPTVEWVVVRPDTLEPGEASEYRVSPEIVASLFRPDHTRMVNVAHFMCELATDPDTWARWQGRMPVITDAV